MGRSNGVMFKEVSAFGVCASIGQLENIQAQQWLLPVKLLHVMHDHKYLQYVIAHHLTHSL